MVDIGQLDKRVEKRVIKANRRFWSKFGDESIYDTFWAQVNQHPRTAEMIKLNEHFLRKTELLLTKEFGAFRFLWFDEGAVEIVEKCTSVFLFGEVNTLVSGGGESEGSVQPVSLIAYMRDMEKLGLWQSHVYKWSLQ